NMMSANDSHHLTTGCAFSPMLVTASANSTEKMTICSTSPSAMALMIEAGDRCAMMSPKVCGLAGGSGAVNPVAAACAASLAFCAAVAASVAACVAACGLVCT